MSFTAINLKQQINPILDVALQENALWYWAFFIIAAYADNDCGTTDSFNVCALRSAGATAIDICHQFLMFTVLWCLSTLWVCWYQNSGIGAGWKRKHSIADSPVILGICILGRTFAYDAWQAVWEVMRSEVDLFEYEPFHSDKLAVPDKKLYSMQEPLLRAWWRNSIIPVYASFVQAIVSREGYERMIVQIIVAMLQQPRKHMKIYRRVILILFLWQLPAISKGTVWKRGKELSWFPSVWRYSYSRILQDQGGVINIWLQIQGYLQR